MTIYWINLNEFWSWIYKQKYYYKVSCCSCKNKIRPKKTDLKMFYVYTCNICNSTWFSYKKIDLKQYYKELKKC